MAETILSVISGGVFEQIGSILLSEISLGRGVRKELKKLEMTLSTIKAVLLDAEEQQARNHEMRDWLEKLKDVVYDVDDVLDEISTEALRRKVEIQRSKLKKVGDFFSGSNPLAFRFKIGHKIKHIRERLESIAGDRRNFHLTEQVANNQVENRVQREQTHSFVLPSNVIGREEDKERIVQLLLSFGDHEDLSVIPIVGLGGLGKTTLAKLVYNDEKVVCNFEKRMWVCVSEDFKLKKVLEDIIKSATTGVICDGLNVDELQIKLRDILLAKKILLVLDDVWCDDPKWWIDFRDLLTGGANGSTIIVTTRNQKTASIMGTITPYNLSRLPYDDCLILLMRIAFKELPEKVQPQLVEFGKEIVNKCGGVPLAVKTLGSLLYMKTDVREWVSIRDDEIWKLKQNEDDILPLLRLSYLQLPSYLKQCFAYCCVFPKDYDILSENLINLWMAQGFLQSVDERRQLEDIGYQYFDEMASKSFFQDLEVLTYVKLVGCRIHDLLHNLAQQVIGTEWMSVDFNSENISERVRHVSFMGDDFIGKEFPTPLLNAVKLRTFFFSYEIGPISKSFLDKLVLHYSCLRVLRLAGAEYEELPSFVANLKHLRYLDLRFNRSLKALPNSICKLVNLQTLNLVGCEQLQNLPRDFGKLVNLRNLYLTTQLICLPNKMLQGLTSLRSLILRKCIRLTSLSEEIQHLPSLRTLRIFECPCLASLSSGLKYLTGLEILVVGNCEELKLLEGEDMRDLRSLRSLTILGLPKLVGLPQGLQHSAATLQFLCIEDCKGLTTLPEWLQGLASLQTLVISRCPNLLSPPEGMQRLTALRRLEIKDSPHLSGRCNKETGEDWPKISRVPEIDIDSYDEDLDDQLPSGSNA